MLWFSEIIVLSSISSTRRRFGTVDGSATRKKFSGPLVPRNQRKPRKPYYFSTLETLRYL